MLRTGIYRTAGSDPLPWVRNAPDLSAALVSLNRVGVNLNQIARMANRGQGVPHDLAEVLAEVRGALERLAGIEE